MNIHEVIRQNQERQALARDLNVRAGEKVFWVLAWEEMVAWINEKIGGVGRLADITNPEILLLPEPDKDMVKLILEENPDAIVVAGRPARVEYGDDSQLPLVQINFYDQWANDWEKIPDKGVFLPGGREVRIFAYIDGYGCRIEESSSQFKKKVSSIFNEVLWARFLGSDKPEIEVPVPSALTATVAEVCVYQYGNCRLTNQPLLAFGAVSYVALGYWKSEGFETRWFQSRQDAETERTKAVSEFVSMRERFAQARQVEADSLRQLEKAKEAEAARLAIPLAKPVTRPSSGGLGSLGDIFAKAGL